MDENIEPAITRGLLRLRPNIDIVTVQQSGLNGYPDREILAWAAANSRIVVSKDRSTMGAEAELRIEQGERMTGLLLIRPDVGHGEVIRALELYHACVNPDEMENLIEYIPLD